MRASELFVELIVLAALRFRLIHFPDYGCSWCFVVVIDLWNASGRDCLGSGSFPLGHRSDFGTASFDPVEACFGRLPSP